MAKIRSKISLLSALLLILSMSLTAAVLQSLEQPDTLLLGSKIYLTLSAEVDLETVIVPDTLSSFSIVKVEKLSIQDKPVSLKLTLLALDTGEQTFPALQVKATQAQADSLFSRAFRLHIRESRNPKDSTLVDIAGSQKLRGELPWWAYYLIGGLLVLSIIGLILYLLLRRKKAKPMVSEEEQELQDLRTAWQKALEAMQALKVQTPANLSPQGTQSTYLLFHFRLSEIIKLFLEEELGFKANEMTTREIRQHFRQQAAVLRNTDWQSVLGGDSQSPSQDQGNPPLSAPRISANTSLHRLSQADENTILKWLESCDRVKFARHEPTVVEYYSRLDEIIAWLQLYGKRVTSPTVPSDSYNTALGKPDA